MATWKRVPSGDAGSSPSVCGTLGLLSTLSSLQGPSSSPPEHNILFFSHLFETVPYTYIFVFVFVFNLLLPPTCLRVSRECLSARARISAADSGVISPLKWLAHRFTFLNLFVFVFVFTFLSCFNCYHLYYYVVLSVSKISGSKFDRMKRG